MDDSESVELLERARSGDRNALETLIERHQAQVYRFGMKMCRDPEDAKDVLQDTLLALARGVRDVRGTSSLSTWLFTVARRFCIKKRRRKRGQPAASVALEQAEEAPDRGPRPDDALSSRQLEDALDAAFRELDPAHREVLLLRDVEGLSAKEVAEVLGIGVAAVKSRLHRARLQVRASIAPLLGTPARPGPPSCPDVLSQYSRFLEDEISAEVCDAMQAHVGECTSCRKSCDSLKQTLALCRASAPEASVPMAVQRQVKEALRSALAEAG